MRTTHDQYGRTKKGDETKNNPVRLPAAMKATAALLRNPPSPFLLLSPRRPHLHGHECGFAVVDEKPRLPISGEVSRCFRLEGLPTGGGTAIDLFSPRARGGPFGRNVRRLYAAAAATVGDIPAQSGKVGSQRQRATAPHATTVPAAVHAEIHAQQPAGAIVAGGATPGTRGRGGRSARATAVGVRFSASSPGRRR